ncbi:MAG: NAD(P)/FAD-dependent oxidoreductase [Actinobacteria bacterium]|nr:NAD(P)/FAD-dependent oxidoreductase [Actinomycetota bacterium]
MNAKSILILGGGIGGVVAANALRKKLENKHQIIVMDKSSYFLFPSHLWVLSGQRTKEQITRPLSILNKKGIKFIQDNVKSINPEKKIVQTDNQSVSFDYLIIALGAELVTDAIPGLSPQDSIYNLYDVDAALKARSALLDLKSGSIVILISSLPFKCPAAPYEASLFSDFIIRKRKVRAEIAISIYTPEILPMPTAGPMLGNAVKQMVEKRGISFNPQHKVVKIDTEKHEIYFEDKRKASFDLLLFVPPHKAPDVLEVSGISGGTGWIHVDRSSLRTKFEDIYAVGDITAVRLPNGMMLPKAGVFAERHAQVVAQNIAAEINGQKTKVNFNGKGACFLEMGYGMAGYAKGNFYAEPAPEILLRNPSMFWHFGKILFEKYWLWKWL